MTLNGQPKKGAKHWAFYWLRVILLIILGLMIEGWLNKKAEWIMSRYTVYQTLHNFTPRKPRPERVALVLIGDDEYWRGELGSRVPIKRDYLARLVEAIDKANPKIIALDFALRSLSPDGNPPEAPEYQGETKKLLEAVHAASANRTIILPKTVEMDNGRYVSESDIYKGFEFNEDRVKKAYIILPDDRRQIPLFTLDLPGEKQPIDSFSQAVARAFDEKSIPPPEPDGSLPFGSYIPIEKFPMAKADEVLRGDPQALNKLAFKAVIISGNWHTRGYNRGPLVDIHDSPLGFIPGVYIHANYAEAILDSRLYWPVKGWWLKGIDIAMALLVGLVFAFNFNPLIRLVVGNAFDLDFNPWIKLMAVPFLCLGLIVFSYLCLVILGAFFDFFIPALLVIGHGVAEQTYHGTKKVLSWRADALKWRQYQKPKKEGEKASDEQAPVT